MIDIVVNEAKEKHMALHEQVRGAMMGRRVLVNSKINGIKPRYGVVADTIFTYDVSIGVDVERLDGVPGYLDRMWFNMRSVEFI